MNRDDMNRDDMNRDELDSLAGRNDDGLGCGPFGHLASPFVDGELPRSELERFGTHLPGCPDCRRLVGEYRSLDALSRPPMPAVAAADWDRTWEGVQAALLTGREQEAKGTLAPMLDTAERFIRKPLPRAARPLLYLAASLALVAILLSVQRSVETPGPQASLVAASQPELECLEPDYVPVAYTIGEGDDAVSVMYCAYVGLET